MAKNKSKKLTIEDLIGARGKKDKLRVKEHHVESLEGCIQIHRCPEKDVLEAMDSITKDESMTNLMEVFKELIYKSVPIFKNGDLQKAYELVEPFDIVTEMLELGEVMELGEVILGMYGFNEFEKTVKN